MTVRLDTATVMSQLSSGHTHVKLDQASSARVDAAVGSICDKWGMNREEFDTTVGCVAMLGERVSKLRGNLKALTAELEVLQGAYDRQVRDEAGAQRRSASVDLRIQAGEEEVSLLTIKVDQLEAALAQANADRSVISARFAAVVGAKKENPKGKKKTELNRKFDIVQKANSTAFSKCQGLEKDLKEARAALADAERRLSVHLQNREELENQRKVIQDNDWERCISKADLRRLDLIRQLEECSRSLQELIDHFISKNVADAKGADEVRVMLEMIRDVHLGNRRA